MVFQTRTAFAKGQLLLVPSHGTELEVTVRRGDTLRPGRRFRTSVKARAHRESNAQRTPAQSG